MMINRFNHEHHAAAMHGAHIRCKYLFTIYQQNGSPVLPTNNSEFNFIFVSMGQNRNDASSMLESPSSSVGSLDPASPRFRANDLGDSGNFYVTMVPLNPNAKVSVSYMSNADSFYRFCVCYWC